MQLKACEPHRLELRVLASHPLYHEWIIKNKRHTVDIKGIRTMKTVLKVIVKEFNQAVIQKPRDQDQVRNRLLVIYNSQEVQTTSNGWIFSKHYKRDQQIRIRPGSR